MKDIKAARADNNYKNHDATAGERSTAMPVRRHASELFADGQPPVGLEAYRRWLTRARAPASRRSPLDPSLYTWKGYRSWSEKVRREWKADD